MWTQLSICRLGFQCPKDLSSNTECGPNYQSAGWVLGSSWAQLKTILLTSQTMWLPMSGPQQTCFVPPVGLLVQPLFSSQKDCDLPFFKLFSLMGEEMQVHLPLLESSFCGRGDPLFSSVAPAQTSPKRRRKWSYSTYSMHWHYSSSNLWGPIYVSI